MSSTSRRQFLKKTALTAGAVSVAPAVRSGFASGSPNDRVNVAVVGFHDRGFLSVSEVWSAATSPEPYTHLVLCRHGTLLPPQRGRQRLARGERFLRTPG